MPISSTSIVCPFCQHHHDDTDFQADAHFSGDLRCEECGKLFHFEAEFSITWWSGKIKTYPEG